MKKKAVTALLIAAMMVFSATGVLALDYGVPEGAISMTARFFVVASGEDGMIFSMISESEDLLMHIDEDTLVYFEDLVPISDDCDEMTQMAREVLFGRTLAEVLDGRNLYVTFVPEEVMSDEMPYVSPISVKILFETAVTLPEPIDLGPVNLEPVYPSPINLEPIDIELNGELVVNGVIITNAPEPFLHSTENGYFIMVPLRAAAEVLGFNVTWEPEEQSVRLGIVGQIWIGSTEAHRGRMTPIALSTAPIIVNETTFVPLDFFREVLAQTAYAFEGQVVIETYSDMM